MLSVVCGVYVCVPVCVYVPLFVHNVALKLLLVGGMCDVCDGVMCGMCVMCAMDVASCCCVGVDLVLVRCDVDVVVGAVMVWFECDGVWVWLLLWYGLSMMGCGCGMVSVWHGLGVL